MQTKKKRGESMNELKTQKSINLNKFAQENIGNASFISALEIWERFEKELKALGVLTYASLLATLVYLEKQGYLLKQKLEYKGKLVTGFKTK